ncbi:MAG: NADH-quinone oxidoreductase subunit J family protein [Aureliella sp.]
MLEVLETILTLAFSGAALLAAIGFVVFRQSVYSALCFTAAVLAASGLYILQNASYVAAATMVIYAGATIIIFLFVLMFAQHSHVQHFELQYSNLGVALVASTCLVLLLGYAVSTRGELTTRPQVVSPAPAREAASGKSVSAAEVAAPSPEQTGTTVADLGRVTYTRYLWAIELAGTLLLIAAGGAIIIAQREPHTAAPSGVSAS